MITGAHHMIYSKDADKDRDFFRDVLKMDNIDSGGGWLIFKLPPSEMAFHPSEKEYHELYLICDDIKQFVAEMKKNNIKCTEIKNEGWGLATVITLPGGSDLGIYQPQHSRP